MTGLMAAGELKIMDTCPNLIREIEGYCWDPKSSEKGFDAPIKSNDHSVDGLRYILSSRFGKGNARDVPALVVDPLPLVRPPRFF